VKDHNNANKILAAFLKVGAVGFGGGSALIPIVEQELVQRRHMLDDGEYLKHTVVANITPGALPVKLGATCGYQLGGTPGSLLGAYAVALPGAALTVGIMALFSLLGTQAIEYINCASVGITAFIVFLLLGYIHKTVLHGSVKTNVILCLIAFLITGGKALREILEHAAGIHTGMPFLSISTIDLMIATFFMIMLTSLSKSKPFLTGGGALCAAYVFFAGNYSKAAGLGHFKNWIIVLMAVLLLILFLPGRKKNAKSATLDISKSLWCTVGLFLLIPVALTAVSAILLRDTSIVDFAFKVFISTITSFGGGEAYVSVADGIFVQGGYIAPEIFYTRLVPVANALPGPILIKIAAGIGFMFGLETGGFLGLILAMAGFTVSAGACGAIAVLVMHLYDNIRESVFIIGLQRYILPVICGMLLSTSCSMIFESMKILADKSISGGASLSVMAASVAALFLITRKRHINDLILLLGAALISMVFLTAVT